MDFWAVRQEKTLALAWALQTHTMESGFPTGVLCESAQELQKCMAPLMAFSSDKIVKASFLRPTGEEHKTSPTPEEETTLLDEVEPPQVPEQLQVHELVHLSEWIATPAASPHPSFLTISLPFPEGKEVPAMNQSEHNQCRPVGLCLLRGEWQGVQMVEDVFDAYSSALVTPQSKNWLPTSCSLLAVHCTAKERWLVEYPTLYGGIGVEELPSPKGFPWNPLLLGGDKGENDCPGHGSLEVHGLIRNALRSAMWSGAGVLPVSCPPSLKEAVSWTWKCWMLPRGFHRSCYCICFPYSKPKEEEQITLQLPQEPFASEPEEATHLAGGLDLIWGRFPSVPPGFAHLNVNWTHTGLARGIPLWTQLDLCSLGSLWVTNSHDLAEKEAWCEYQSWVITQALLQMPQLIPSESSLRMAGRALCSLKVPRIQELWVNMMFFLPPTSDSTTPQLIDHLRYLGVSQHWACQEFIQTNKSCV